MRGAIAGVGVALVAASLVAGCSSILGDFSLESATSDDGGHPDGSANDAPVDGNSPVPDTGTDAPVDSTIPDGNAPEDGGTDGDTGPSCTSPCAVGEKQCQLGTDGGSLVQSCEQLDASCTSWVTTTSCAASQSCTTEADGGAQCACASTLCTTTGPTCTNSNTAIATCTTDPTTGCNYVSATTPCPSSESCGGFAGKAVCGKGCSDSCDAGASECVTGNLAQCATQSNGCLGFGNGSPCPDTEQTCVASGSTASCVCQNPAACGGLAGNTCTQGTSYVSCTKDSNGCLVSTSEACSPNATCSGKGASASPCTCNLGYSGDGTTCNPTGCVISGKYYPNGTIDPTNACQSCQISASVSGWSPVTNGSSCGPTGSGEVCTAGACACPSTAPTLCGVMCMPAGTSCSAATVCTGANATGESNELAIDGTTAYWAYSDEVLTCPLSASGATAAVHASFPHGKLLYTFNVISVAWDGASGVYYAVKPSTETFTSFYWDSSPTTSSANDFAYDTSDEWVGVMASDNVSRGLFFMESNGVYRLDVTATDPDGGYPDSPCMAMTTPALVNAGGGWVTSYDSGQSSIVGAPASGSGCGTQVAIATGSYVGTVTAITNDGSGLAFANASGVYLCPLTGCGASPTPLAGSQGAVDSIALDANFVYWVGTSGLVACSRSGCSGSPTVIVAGATATHGIAVDATNVYYFDETNGIFYRVAK